jgi:hypothetical protein
LLEKKAHPKMGQKFHGNKKPLRLSYRRLLAAFAHPSHRVIYAPGDSLSCRLAAARSPLSIIFS